MLSARKRVMFVAAAAASALVAAMALATPPATRVPAEFQNERVYVHNSLIGTLIYQKAEWQVRKLYITHHNEGPADKLRLPAYGWIRVNDEYFPMVPVGNGDLTVTVPWDRYDGAFEHELELYDTNDVLYYAEYLTWEPF
ncbi:MAG: hypothetical protein HRF50_02820 [Phycisphaerae bacterium]|jgi:hypothetical protein